MTEFESSMPGMNHLMKSFPGRNTLFLPEGLVDEVPSQRRSVSSDVPCEALKMSPEEIKEQKKALELAKKNKIAKEDHEKIAALKAAEESVNLPQQQEAYRKEQTKAFERAESNKAALKAAEESVKQNREKTSFSFGADLVFCGGGRGVHSNRPSYFKS